MDPPEWKIPGITYFGHWYLLNVAYTVYVYGHPLLAIEKAKSTLAPP